MSDSLGASAQSDPADASDQADARNEESEKAGGNRWGEHWCERGVRMEGGRGHDRHFSISDPTDPTDPGAWHRTRVPESSSC